MDSAHLARTRLRGQPAGFSNNEANVGQRSTSQRLGQHCYVDVIVCGDVRQLGSQQGIHLDFARSEEHTSELQSLMRISYAVFCLKKKKYKKKKHVISA